MASNEFIEGFAKETDLILGALGFQRNKSGRTSWTNLVYVYKFENSKNYIFISFRYITSGEIETGMNYYHHDIYQIFERCHIKLSGFQKWIFAVNHLSFPEWSGRWDMKIKDRQEPEKMARELFSNIRTAFPVFRGLCTDINLALEHISTDTSIGAQLSLMIDHRIDVAVCIAIFLNKPDVIHDLVLFYSEKYMNSINFDFIANKCASFIKCQMHNGNLDSDIAQKCISELEKYF